MTSHRFYTDAIVGQVFGQRTVITLSDSMPKAAHDPATCRKTKLRVQSAIIVAIMMSVAGCSSRSCPNGVPTMHGDPIVCGGCTCTPTKWYQVF